LPPHCVLARLGPARPDAHAARPEATLNPTPQQQNCIRCLQPLYHSPFPLQSDEVADAGAQRAEEVGEPDAVVLRLAREGEALELALGVGGVETPTQTSPLHGN